MKERKLMHMRRAELVEIIYQLQQTEEELRAELEQVKSELEDRRIRIGEAGTVAEAALSLSGIFEAARKAVDIYNEEMALREGEQSTQSGETDEPDDIYDTDEFTDHRFTLAPDVEDDEITGSESAHND